MTPNYMGKLLSSDLVHIYLRAAVHPYTTSIYCN